MRWLYHLALFQIDRFKRFTSDWRVRRAESARPAGRSERASFCQDTVPSSARTRERERGDEHAHGRGPAATPVGRARATVGRAGEPATRGRIARPLDGGLIRRVRGADRDRVVRAEVPTTLTQA